MEAAGVASGEDAGAPSDHPKVYRSTLSDSYQIWSPCARSSSA
jgi:hypothetical protein